MSAREDWTTGRAVVQLTRCSDCAAQFYLPRERCPRCRSAELVELAVSGAGTAVAVTHGGVVGGPGADGEARGLALVDLDDGVRMMTTAASGVLPGGRVAVTVVRVADGGLAPLATPV